MRPNHGEAEFEGRRLQSLRNLPLSFFSETDDFFSEADDLQYPEPAPIDRETERNFLSITLPQPEHTNPPSLELGNKALPIHEHLKAIVETVNNTAVTIIAADTGTGKSTQVPQALYASGRYDTIYLTQPRRAAAFAIRDRIRKEMDATLPGAGDRLTCYQTAINREGPDDAPIRVVTDGLQLVREFHDSVPGQKKVIIIDELHERNFNIDLLAALAKHAISNNPDMRVVIMSATIDTQRVANYFADVCPQPPTIIEVPGRNFHVQRLERRDSTVVQETLTAAKQLYASNDEQNTILVFQPGKAEIKDTIDEVRRLLPAEIRKVATILPFHSKLPKDEQDLVFREYPGRIVVIVSTNSAQTSLTLPRIKYIIDSGLERRVELDHEGTQGLVLHQISQADCDQRAGRAGRVSDGIYIGTRGNENVEYVLYKDREKYPLPEILRTDIVRNTLRCAAAGLDIAEIGLLDSPSAESIERAKATLRAYDTIDENNMVTPLGLRIDQYPLRVSSARMMIEAARYSEQTRAYVAAIVSAREVGGLQLFGRDIGRRWRGPDGLTEEETSDHLAQLDIFIATQGMNEREMRNYDLDVHNVQRTNEQFRKIAKLANAPVNYLLPPTLAERVDITSCVVAGLTHSIYKHAGDGQYQHIGGSETSRVLSNRSVVTGRPAAVVGDPYRVEFFAAGEKIVRHTIEYPTVVQLADLGRVAAHLTGWKHDDIAMRAGKFVEVQRQYLGDIDLGVTREVVAEPSPRLREAVIAHAMEHAGPQQQQLRDIKRRLEQLARLSKDPVPQLTQDRLKELVARAAPADITDPADLDYNLRRIVQDENISLASYVTPEREQYIVDNAPEVIAADNVVLQLTYRDGKPIAIHIRKEDVAALKNDVFLRDGREVKFRYGHKVMHLYELQESLATHASAQLVL